MNNIEKRLAEERMRMESITVPDELEMRLRSALNTAAPKRKKRIAAVWKIAAVILVVVVLSGNNYNAFAYYGKQLLGFDELIHGTLKQLNDEGMGQIVDERTHLEDGTELIINGIMTDANQLIMYYTLTNPNGIEEQQGDHFRLSKISGFLTDSNVGGGTSLINEDHTEMKGTMSFDSVSPFSKKLTLHFWQIVQNGQMAEGTITFPYNPNAALQTKIKQSINKSFKVDKGSITFRSITATPTMTVIDGTLNVANFDRVRLALDSIELKANGIPIEIIGSGIQSSFRGMKFDISYDTLPKQLDSLELVMKQFVGYEKLNERISLASLSDEPLILDGKELWVKKVSTTSKGVEITIATAEDVMLDGVSIETENEITSLKTTVNQNVSEQKNGQLMKERTLLFDTVIEPEYLLIKGMHYMKAYNNVIKLKVD
ncbi:hypothetical protein FHS15_001781 [Paenibacillus castaneae]|uniref:DUF4179 domain-containing protein n=1 Tax=Paenibacillus castaneae TaxID=474957 RepID=UPI000C9AF87F|nr:DUF4179 domain-containing protein [Paenibacillus castaneae]NIK76656.1 hypothetical protein [Paenibacillus castaneae]